MDDGFQWLDALEAPLQKTLWSLVGWVSDGEHSRVEAAVPAIVADARAKRLPWVEVFARNMRLRSVVLHREDTRAGLAEAVALTERASREDMADCPQTICVAHALCAAYGLRDGPGHAAIRQTVSTETLSRIDPRQVCFLCISNEHADALMDAGDPEQALDFLATQTATRREAGAPVDSDDFGLREAAALIALNRVDDALARLEAAHEPHRGESWLRTWGQWKARALAEKGDEGAIAFLSPLDALLDDGGFRLHVATLDALDRHGLFTTDEGIRHRTIVGTVAIQRGVARTGVHALCTAATSLVAQGEKALALAALDHAGRGVAELESPASVQSQIASLMRQAEALGSGPPNTFQSVLESAQTAEDVNQLTQVWRTFGFHAEAVQCVQEAAASQPDNDDLFCAAASALLNAGDDTALQDLLARPPATEDGPSHALWYRALGQARTDVPSAIHTLQDLVARQPSWLPVADRLGALCFSQERYEDALQVWTEAANANPRPNGFDWDVIAAATMLQRWSLVREVGISLGFPLEAGEEPVNQALGSVRVDFNDDSAPFLASRISPLTARVESLRRAGEPQKHGQIVLFHPEILNTEEREASESWVPPLHRVITVVSAPDEPFEGVDIDGLHPGDAALTALFERAEAADIPLVRAAGDDYSLAHPETGEAMPAFYLVAAIQPSRAGALLAILEGMDGVVTYPGPLEMAGRSEDAASHEALREAWGM